MEQIKKIWTWIKDHERIQGIMIVVIIEAIGLLIIWSIKCGL